MIKKLQMLPSDNEDGNQNIDEDDLAQVSGDTTLTSRNLAEIIIIEAQWHLAEIIIIEAQWHLAEIIIADSFGVFKTSNIIDKQNWFWRYLKDSIYTDIKSSSTIETKSAKTAESYFRKIENWHNLDLACNTWSWIPPDCPDLTNLTKNVIKQT